jgi:hypothetical protein
MKTQTLSLTVGLLMVLSVESVRSAEKQTGGKNGTVIGIPWFTSDSNSWKRVPYEAVAPTGGVSVAQDGLFKPVMERSVAYLLADWRSNVDDMLLWPRRVAKIANPPGQIVSWFEGMFPSHAASFLLGAGSTLQWQERPELRSRLNQVIEGLKACRLPDGGLKTPVSNLPCACFSIHLFAHGIMSAGMAGNKDAWELLSATALQYRQDVAAATAKNPRWGEKAANYYGVSACAVEALSPGGVKADIECALKHTHPRWMKMLADRNPAGIWQPPVSYPHAAATYGFVGYLDLYRLTGDRRLLDAMLGAWELMSGYWQQPGGSFTICEQDVYPPGSLYITPYSHTGEFCAIVWWIKLNQKVHQLFPMQERYVNEIEKCIYNVGLSNQDQCGGVRYHTNLEGSKDWAGQYLSCCESVGPYLYGSLPEYIFTLANDGLFVNLYEPSSITWKLADQSPQLIMTSRFPFRPEVTLRLQNVKPIAMKLRIRAPAWAAKDMPIMVNGKLTAVGKPGSYVVLDRTWGDGDQVEFTLPMDFRVTVYEGADQIPGHKRSSIMYGPIVMAALGPMSAVTPYNLPHNFKSPYKPRQGPNITYLLRIQGDPKNPSEWLTPLADQPLNFSIVGQGEHFLKPYWQVGGNTRAYDENEMKSLHQESRKSERGLRRCENSQSEIAAFFTCFPVIEPKEKVLQR